MTDNPIWQTPISAAMLGTERQALIVPQTNQESVDRLLARIDTTNPAKALLRAAAVLELAEKAGRVPPIGEVEAVSACIAEELPMCSPLAAESLQRMLAGEYAHLLPQWLETVAAAGFTVPPEYLPQLLSWGSQNGQWRSHLLPVLGHRGRWLAAQNPQWQYAEASLDRSIWETGTSAMRLWVLQLMRQSDPARAREWVSSTWKQDKAPDRAAFLAIFKSGLSLEDEALLEFSLNDKSKLIRAIAADLLARLADSQLTHRAIDRATPCLKIVTQPSLAIEVSLPQLCDDAAVRDGIVLQPPSGMGEKSWWLLQLLAQVPPKVWTATPTEFLTVAATHPLSEVLLEGMAIAAERHRDLDWAQAILKMTPTFPGSGNTLAQVCQNLMEMLPIERREALVWQVLETEGDTRLKKNHPLLFLGRSCRHLWSPELSLAVLHRLAIDISTSQDTYNWGVRSIVKDFADFIHPAVVGDAKTLLKTAVKADSYWAQTVDEVLEILQFRNEMLTGIWGEPPWN